MSKMFPNLKEYNEGMQRMNEEMDKMNDEGLDQSLSYEEYNKALDKRLGPAYFARMKELREGPFGWKPTSEELLIVDKR